MEVGQQVWGGGGGRHTRSNSSIQPPWECDLSEPATLGPDTSPPPIQHSPSNGGVGGSFVGYLDSSSLPPSPLETLYRRTASFSRSSVSSSPVTSPSTHEHHHQLMAGDGGRTKSLSGPLPSPDDHSPMAYPRRPSLSGPLPNSSNNPYSPGHSFDEMLLPGMKTPSPWSEFHSNNATSNGSLSNPYLNPQMFSPNGSVSGASSNSSLSPSSLPRPPHYHNSNGNDATPTIASPSSVGSPYGGNHHIDQPRGPPVRQLYGYNQQVAGLTDPFASLVVGTPLSHPTSQPPSNGEQWASFPQKSLNGKPMPGTGLSQRTHGAPLATAGRVPGDSLHGGAAGAAETDGPLRRGSPSLTKSRSAQNGVYQNGDSGTNGRSGGVLPFNTRGTLSKSASFSGAEVVDLARTYSKGRGGLGEGVLETLVAQLVFAKEKPSMLADMIFCPSKLSTGVVRDSKGPFAYARDLVERILYAQVHALTPSFKGLAQKSFELDAAAVAAAKNGKTHERFPNEGYRLLRLQTQFVEAGLDTFDMLCRVRKQFPSLMMVDSGGIGAALLRIGCFGGGPGCEALAIRLFFMRLLPKQVQMQVDIFDRRERWKEIVDNFSLKGIGFLTVDLFDVVFHPTWLRSYRLLVFIDSLGGGGRAWRSHNWAEFWSDLFRNTSPGVVVVIQEKTCPWEQMKPQKGSKWWCSALAEQELVHVARKM